MISVHSLKDCLRISGLISKPTLSKGNRNFEYFFINGRSIKNHVLQRAVEEAYKGRITIGKFPFVVLHLYIDPQTIDVNVHPNKLEVRLQNSDLIYDTVLTTLTTHLKETNLIPMPSFEKTSEKKKSEQPPSQLIVDTLLSPYRTTSSFSPEKLVPIPPKENLITPIKSSLFESIPEEVTTILEVAETPELYGKTDSLMPSQTPTLAPVKEGLDYTIIGQIFATYWLVDYRNKLLMIDQHAAHERLNYEKFMADFRQNQIATQLLLVPDTHMVTAFEKEWLIAYQDKLSHLGFLFEFFGEESIIVREVPYLFHAPLPLENFYYLLESLKTQKVSHLYDLTEEHIIQLACKYSVKANDKLSKAECQALIEALLNLENPFTCPHGRPTIIAFTKYEIEKLFKRV
jgi:DNA mismatch repair protein MutL